MKGFALLGFYNLDRLGLIERDIKTELDNVTYSFWILRQCIDSTNELIEVELSEHLRIRRPNFISFRPLIHGISEVNQAYQLEENKIKTLKEDISLFCKAYVEPVCFYLIEQMESPQLTLSLLLKYKHKVEWFQRKHLNKLLDELLQEKDDEKKRRFLAEKGLSKHFYEYLYDQGVHFEIEPSSLEGEIDLVEAQNQKGSRLLADAKVFKSRRDNIHIADGFRQMYRYTKRYNQEVGFLIIFKTIEDDLVIELDHKAQSTPFLQYNHKTIFAIVIDVFNSSKSPSQTPKIKPIRVTKEKIFELIEAEEKAQNEAET